ncbi:hypothetical protein ACOMHN_017766 [Nucella lapillus]
MDDHVANEMDDNVANKTDDHVANETDDHVAKEISHGTDTGDSEGEGADSEGEGTEVNTPTSEELNLIVNVGCLQTIIGWLACPECHKTIKIQFALMGMPQSMSESIWYFYKQKIHMGVKRAADKHLQEAANQIRRTYADMNIGLPNDAGVLNISVSIDGSWQKRGHSSHNGVVTVIETMTGLVVDFIALSNYCQGCESGPKPEDANYEQWAQDHRSKCQKNIHCSPGAMEMEGAVKISERSVDLHGFRYTEMLGDGDAKTYKRVIEADPYEGYPIEKLECVNHVTKRMGTALRNLVQKRKAQSQTISGRGRLTDIRIKKLTNYYGSAIKKECRGSGSDEASSVGHLFPHFQH